MRGGSCYLVTLMLLNLASGIGAIVTWRADTLVEGDQESERIQQTPV